jgi:hypothetical protein
MGRGDVGRWREGRGLEGEMGENAITSSCTSEPSVEMCLISSVM